VHGVQGIRQLGQQIRLTCASVDGIMRPGCVATGRRRTLPVRPDPPHPV